MKKELLQFTYEEYSSAQELEQQDRELLDAAQLATGNAYAPYSLFQVGAAAKLANGAIVSGGNQENASFPAGLCAEGVVLANAASRFPGVPIKSMAISYHSEKHKSDHPISPCGICRQSLQEFSERTGSNIRLIMGGETGRVVVLPEAAALLPFAFKF